MNAAKQAHAAAIHPGYGFLSENASFCRSSGFCKFNLYRPSAASIRAMGDKAESKISMKKAGVPTVPGMEKIEAEEDFKACRTGNRLPGFG